MLVVVVYRISSGAIPSTTLSTGKVIVSNERYASQTFGEAMGSILGAFNRGTWMLLFGRTLMVAIAYFLINYSFLRSSSLKAMYNAMLEPFVPKQWLLQNCIDDVVSDNSKESRTHLIRVRKRSAILFFIISILFWEIGFNFRLGQ